MVLRLTMPAAAPFRGLAVELAAKVAEYAGRRCGRRARAGAEVETSLTAVAAATPAAAGQARAMLAADRQLVR